MYHVLFTFLMVFRIHFSVTTLTLAKTVSTSTMDHKTSGFHERNYKYMNKSDPSSGAAGGGNAQ